MGKFLVRIVVNVEVEAEAMPGAAGDALAYAELIAAQALVQNTEGTARTLPGKATVRRMKKSGK